MVPFELFILIERNKSRKSSLICTEMSGLYIHIPFCRKACHYCNFHFSTSLGQREAMLTAILKEIERRNDFLEDKTLESIYFGGGTPSVFSAFELASILDLIGKYFHISADSEITIEANPDDLNKSYVKALSETSINRLSIGVQSFHEKDLIYMNRSHDAEQAIQSIKNSQDLGFSNLSVDLIYGTPGLSEADWISNLNIIRNLDIPHLSCYSLTVEDKTALAHMVKTGESPAPKSDEAARHLKLLMAFAKEESYEHYEISNFAKAGKEAVHNSNYWKGIPYLGIGPAAHSFNGKVRQWNPSNNAKYIKAMTAGLMAFENETLTPDDKYNEYILTGLRTKWGCEVQKIAIMGEIYKRYFLIEIESKIRESMVMENEGIFTLTEEGKFFADQISADLFYSGS